MNVNSAFRKGTTTAASSSSQNRTQSRANAHRLCLYMFVARRAMSPRVPRRLPSACGRFLEMRKKLEPARHVARARRSHAEIRFVMSKLDQLHNHTGLCGRSRRETLALRRVRPIRSIACHYAHIVSGRSLRRAPWIIISS